MQRTSIFGMLLTVVFLSQSCAAVQEMVALRNVDFNLDRISNVQLAGIDLNNVKTYSDLGFLDVARLAQAISEQSLPLQFQLHINAENPSDNKVAARLIGMDWTLFLNERETISGTLADNIVLQPGQPQDIPLSISLDLVEFFESNARDLGELALSLSGEGNATSHVMLKAIPRIDTPLGPISYPQPLTIVSRQVGP